MMNQSHRRHVDCGHTGSTLTEVLVSVMVLGIGLVSVATLFPLSVVRALKANENTQATLLRYNAEAAISVYDFDTLWFFTGGDGRPGTANNDDTPDAVWNSGVNYPYALDTDEFDLSITGNPDPRAIIIDPLGWNLMAVEGAAYQNRWGGSINAVQRLNGGHPGNNTGSSMNPDARPFLNGGSNPTVSNNFGFTEEEAREIVTLPDQFSTVADAPVENVDTTNWGWVDLASSVERNIMSDLASQIAGPSDDSVQVVIQLLDGSYHSAQVLNTSTNRRVQFTPPLPTGSNPERVVLQVVKNDFTWLLTVTTSSSTVTAGGTTGTFNIVVFRNRRFSIEDERLYVNNQYNLTTNQLRVNYTTAQKPKIKRGGFVFDAENGEWYQILDVEDEKANPLVLTLNRPILDRDQDGELLPSFPQGVVDVFETTSRQLRTSL
ncbi:hypothetical protein OAK91_02260 [Planctomycetaceae bacterium]|nr:hypothetical protein [Planctomycetaceae bacterium]